MTTMQIVTMRRRGVPIGEIAERSGMTREAVANRLKAYEKSVHVYAYEHCGRHGTQRGGAFA